AALDGSLPNLITLDDLHGDLHCHTNWTDGSATLDDMARAARARGYQYMALTDHSRSLTITNGLSLERLEEARRLVAQLNVQLAPFVILLGTEMDILQDVSHPLVSTFNHPHGRLLGIRPTYAVDMPRVIETAVASGTALEVSGD